MSRRPAPQVAQPKHLLCEFPVGGNSSAYLAGSCWKNHTQSNRISCAPSYVHVYFEVPLFSRVGVRHDAQIVASFVPTGNTQLSLASGKQIFRSPIWVSDVLIICRHLFLLSKSDTCLFSRPITNFSLSSRICMICDL